jgi:hypothetical protein
MNKPRARKIRTALRHGGYETAADMGAAITDALADLRHACDLHGLDFAKLDAIAYQHYIEENGRTVES